MTMKNFDLPANFLSYLDKGALHITCDGEPTINFHVDGSTKIIDIIDIPIEITKKGWIFDPQKGEQIQGKYIFGENTSVNENELKFSLNTEAKNIKDKAIQIKITEVAKLLTELSKTDKVGDSNLVDLLQYYELVKEIKLANGVQV